MIRYPFLRTREGIVHELEGVSRQVSNDTQIYELRRHLLLRPYVLAFSRSDSHFASLFGVGGNTRVSIVVLTTVRLPR